jgi:uncharacterized membrane protein
MTTSHDKLAASSRTVVLVTYVVLLLLFTYTTIIVPPLQREPSYLVLMMHLLPLLLFLPGMLRGNPRSYIKLCFILLLYFMLSVANMFIPEYGWYPWLETAVLVVLFVAAMMHARWRQRQLNELFANNKTENR